MAPRSTPLSLKKSCLAGVARFAPVLLLAAGLFLPACSEQTKAFDAAWNAPSEFITTPPEVSMAGKWEGTWQSNSYDYFDGLCRAVITPSDVSDEVAGAKGKHYRVDIKLFYYIVPRDFAFTMTAAPGIDGKTALTAEKDFGAMSDGLWRFEGDAEGRSMFLSFTTVKDYGTITLRRYPAPNP
jgi:hypothetical protein